MNHTTNYQLSQWAKSDQVLMEDFNADNAKIDAALKAQADVLAGKGNCQLWTTSYYGNGKTSPTITFPKWPRLVFVISPTGFLLMFPGSSTAISVNPNATHSITASWSGNSVFWYGGADWVMMCVSGTAYQVVALLPA